MTNIAEKNLGIIKWTADIKDPKLLVGSEISLDFPMKEPDEEKKIFPLFPSNAVKCLYYNLLEEHGKKNIDKWKILYIGTQPL